MFLTYEEDTKRLRMNDGTFWVMNAEASEGEEDAGTRYPTLMQDTNGNQIRIDYQQGRSAVYTNSSGRPTYLWDGGSKVASGVPTWRFSYSIDGYLELIYSQLRVRGTMFSLIRLR